VTTLSAKADSFLGHARAIAPRFVPKAPSEPKDIECGVVITRHHQTADRTMMNTNSKSFRYDSSAVGAPLCCAVGVNPDKLSASFFRFAFKYGKELSPASIRYAFGKMMILNHVCNLKVFNGYPAVSVNNISSELVSKVFALILGLLILLRQQLDSLASVASTFLAPRHFSVCFTKCCLCFSEVSRIPYRLIVAGDSERCESHINSNLPIRNGQRFSINSIGKHRIPFATLPLDCDSLDFSFQRAMHLDFNFANIQHIEPITLELDAVAIGWECDRVKAMPASKSRKPWLLFSLLKPSKESLERFIKSAKHVLSSTVVQKCVFGICVPNLFNLIGLVIVVKRNVVLLPSVSAFLKPSIIKGSGYVKQILKSLRLNLAGIHPVKECFTHLFALLLLNILSNCRFANVSDCANIIAPRPKARQLGTQLRKFRAKYMRGITFKLIHNMLNRLSGLPSDGHMNVVRLNLHYFYLNSKLLCFEIKHLFEAYCDATRKHLFPVLGTPDKVILNVEDAPCISLISFNHGDYYTTDNVISQVLLRKEVCCDSSVT